MKLNLLLVATILAIAGVFFLLMPGSEKDQPESNKLFPEFGIEQLNQVTEIAAMAGETTLTLSKQNGDWGLVNFHHYPANTLKIRTLLQVFMEAEKLAEKTSDKNYYKRLGVHDPDTTDGSNRLVTISGNDFSYQLIFGSPSKQISTGQYVRIPNQAASWLINQRFTEPLDNEDWLNKEIVDIDAPDIMEISVYDVDKPEITYTLSRKDPSQTLQLMPVAQISSTLDLSTKSQKLAHDITRLMGITNYMIFKRVWLLADMPKSEQSESQATETDAQENLRLKYTTFDGLILHIDAYEQLDRELFRISSETSKQAGATAQSKSAALNKLTANYVYEMPSSVYSGLLISHQKVVDQLYPQSSESPQQGN